MDKWKIYHKDGTVLTDANGDEVIVHDLEYTDSWMGECFVTISFRHNAPINFSIGDYIMYRGERFELNYDPGKEKQSRVNTYGEGFVYDSVKFHALQDELSRSEFLDVVLNDNQLHYTSLPKFPFYVETIDDLLDRIQANLDEQIGNGKWKIFSRSLSRSMQRGVTKEEWNAVYGEGTKEDTDFDSQGVTVDSQNCWQALALVNEKWDINFIVRNRNIYVGTAGKLTQGIFKYGLGKGLYEIDQNADSDQSVITRLRAYGSEKNLPSHYYADLGIKYKSNITKVDDASTFAQLELDLEYIDTYFKNPRKYVVSSGSPEQTYGWVLTVTFDFKTIITGYVTKNSDGKCMFYSELKNGQTDNGDEESKEKLDAFIKQVNEGNTLLYFTSGINKKTIPYENKEYAENLPNNMSISRLMLPGFPHLSLKEFWDSLTDAEKKHVNPSGKEHIFSTDKYRPYIDSVNIEKIGLRSGSQFFDTDDKTNGVIEIYPTIEEMEIGGVRIDEIYKGSEIADNGRFNDGETTISNFDIYLNPAIDFDINDLRNDDFSINMKDGMCGGRTFKVASATKIEGMWRLSLERVKDDALDLYFPYNDYQIKKGDHFVLTGIELPESYIKAAALKLLKYAIALLDKNDYTRYVYQPKVDEIFMARQHDEAMSDETGAIVSYHDTLKAGDIMQFEDDDLGIDAQITIDQLTIKEEDGKIPTYEITLREDKEVGTIQKIQNTISSIQNGNGGGGATVEQVKGQVSSEGSKYFLSKLSPDTAKEVITFAKGLVSNALAQLKGGATFGNNGYHFDTEGNLVLDTLNSSEFDEALEKGFGFTKNSLGKYTLSLHNLIVWGKAIFNELEIRKLSHVDGNVVLSAAASKIIRVEEVLGSDGEVSGWKCYILADDGTTQTTNGWVVNDQAKCQQFNVKEGVYSNVSNRYYWRAVTAVSTEAETIYETREVDNGDGSVTMEKYDLYDGKKFHYIILSKSNCENATNDAPTANDTIVLDGHQLHKNSDASLTERTNLMMMETTGSGVPRIVALTGVTDFKHDTSNEVFILSPSKVTFVSQYFEFRSASGNAIKLINNRGAWVEGEKYYYYDQVIYENAYWTCIVSGDGAYTTEKPSADSTAWRKDLEIGESVKVESTEVAYAYSDGTKTPPTQPSDSEFSYKNIQDVLGKMDISDYLWSRTTVTYTDGNSSVTYSVSRMGADGENGEKGANGMTTHFAYAEGIVFGDDGKATGVSGTFSTTLFNGAQYIGTYTDDKLTDSTDFKAYSWTKLKGERGDKGDQGEKGDDGKAAVVYSVIMSYATAHVSSALAYGFSVKFRKTTGNTFTDITINSNTTTDYCQAYVDGAYNQNITEWLSSGNSFIDYSAYSGVIKPNSKIKVDWYNKAGALLASGNYDVAGGSVTAYCNSDSEPNKPTSTDVSSLGGGWSLTPKSGGAYTSFGNVSYGNFSVGSTKSGYTTSEWSDAEDGGYVWKKSPAGLSDSYGWALMKVSFTTGKGNVSIEVALKAYSESSCDTIQIYGLDTEVTMGSDNHSGGIQRVSGNGQSATYTYNIAEAGSHFFYVAYAKDTSVNEFGDYGLFRIVSTPTTVTTSSTVWMSKADVKDGRVQLPWSDPVKVTGEDGDSALEIIVSPDTLIFDSDENGLVSYSMASAKTATISCYRNGVKVTNITYSSPSTSNCKASVSSSNGTATVKLASIDEQTVSVDGNTTIVSKTSGSVSLTAYDPKTRLYHQVQVKFQVNVSKFTGSFSLSNKQLSSKFSELTNNGAISKLTDYRSQILQTAREISLSVSEKAVGRRNMLYGSAFRKKDEGPRIYLYGDYIGDTYTNGYYGDQGIYKNGGVDGINCLKVKAFYDGSNQQWPGIFYNCTDYDGLGNIKIEKNKKYVISFYFKCDTVGAYVCLEVNYKTSKSSLNTERVGSALIAEGNTYHYFTSDEVGKWILGKVVIDTSNAGDNEYLAVQIWLSHIKTNVLATAWFCRLMMEEGDTYNGWTLSEQDYDYVGGNLLDNAASLEVGGNLIVQESEIKENNFEQGVNARYAKVSSGCKALAQWGINQSGKEIGLQPNTDYIFSFWAKGKSLTAYAYRGDNSAAMVTEDCNGNSRSSSSGDDGNSYFILTSQWKRYWVHWRTRSDKIPQMILLRTYDEAWIAKPKLEVGCTMTDWTEKRTDMVDKQALLATGIDIKNKKITVTANNFVVQNNSGDTTMTVDEDGNLCSNNASFKGNINATGGTFENISGENIKISGSTRNPFVLAEKVASADFADNVVARSSTENSWVNLYSLPWDASQSGRLVRLANCPWDSLGDTVSSYVAISAQVGNGKYFYYDGKKKELLYIQPYEIVELLGYGTSTTFYGWVVVNRSFMTKQVAGQQIPIVMMGNVFVEKQANGNFSLMTGTKKSYDGGSVSCSRTNTGQYKVYFPSSVSTYLKAVASSGKSVLYDTVLVQLTGIGYVYDTKGAVSNSPAKATLANVTTDYFEVLVSDDETLNDGSFNFVVMLLDDMRINS